jgi:integrase
VVEVSRKRGNGEGTLHRRKNGSWCAQYTVHTAEGSKRKTVYGKTRREVDEKLTKAKVDRERGLVFEAGNLTLGKYLERWLVDSVRGSVRVKTYEGYETAVRVHVAPAMGRIKLRNVTPTHLRGLYREKLDAGLSTRTVQYLHVTLRQALGQAVKDGLVPRNVADVVNAPRVVTRQMQPLTSEQAKAFVEAAKGDRHEALYVLAVTTGIRRGELLGLKWEDLELDAGVLRVKRALAPDARTFAEPKTAKSRRSVRLTSGAVRALQWHRERQSQAGQRLNSLWQEHGLVFPSMVGTPLNPENLVKRSFKPLLEHVGLPPIRFHDLRHTCATLLLSKSVNPKIVQEMLGHANISVTLDIYSHVLPDMQEEAAAAMDDVFS